MRVHDTATRRNAFVEQRLHHRALTPACHTARVALPVAPCPGWLERCPHHRADAKGRVVALSQLPSSRHKAGQALDLLASNRSLNVGQTIVETDDRVLLERHFGGLVADGIRHAHSVVAQQPETLIEIGTPGRQHPAVASGEKLAWME